MMNEKYQSQRKIADILLGLGLEMSLIEAMTSLNHEEILKIKKEKM